MPTLTVQFLMRAPAVPHKKSTELTIIGLDSSDSWIDMSEEFAFERMKLAG
jgi:hypothetical protein